MAGHLSEEELELITKYLLKGEALLGALSHLEECEECRSKIKSPTKAEILENLFTNDTPTKENDKIKEDSNIEMTFQQNLLRRFKNYFGLENRS